MSDQTIAAARARLGAAARACNEHIADCRPCGRALYKAAQLADARRPDPPGPRDERCDHGARLAAEMTAAGMEMTQELELTAYANTH